MSFQLQRARPLDALQRIVSSFKHFERKLDKLQDDVNFHGQTLHELRMMVTNLAGGSILSPDGKCDFRRSQKKTTAIQYDTKILSDDPMKSKRKMVVQSMPSKLKAKSFQCQRGARVAQTDSTYYHTVKKYPSNAVGVVGKQSLRLRKAEAPRKANTLRPQKAQDIKKKMIMAK